MQAGIKHSATHPGRTKSDKLRFDAVFIFSQAITMRLDQLLVTKKDIPSRQRAKELIKHGGVLLDGKVVTKPSMEVGLEAKIELIKNDIPWVSRAGLKLEHALTHWDIDVVQKCCADFGACTGGFTQVLIAHDAKKVFAIDVGHGQLAKKLQEDARVINMEGVHIKDICSSDFAEPLDFICIDTSFISLSHILPKAQEILTPAGSLVALIKPQFEVGKDFIKKGIVTDPELHHKAIELVRSVAAKLRFQEVGLIESPILGGKGNKEFLIYLKKPTT